MSAGLGSVRALPHRLEPVGEASGVLWVNDSKATNVAATRSALESLDRPVVLLLGGKDKGEDFSVLAPAVSRRARAVLAYGAVAERAVKELAAALGGEATGGGSPTGPGAAEAAGPPTAEAAGPPTVEHVIGGLDRVVARAREISRAGDVALLSPACSSFDMYESYEHRGRHFTDLVREGA